MKVMKKGKRHSHSGEKKKNKRYREQNLDVEIIVATQNSEDGVMYNPHCKAEEIQGLDGHRDSDTGAAIKPCRSKKDKKKRKEVQDSPEKEGEGCNQVEVYIISSVDDDCSKGMKISILCIMHSCCSQELKIQYLLMGSRFAMLLLIWKTLHLVSVYLMASKGFGFLI
ncbi:hypothetical protein HKD37_11G032055 [Glycine soja]